MGLASGAARVADGLADTSLDSRSMPLAGTFAHRPIGGQEKGDGRSVTLTGDPRGKPLFFRCHCSRVHGLRDDLVFFMGDACVWGFHQSE